MKTVTSQRQPGQPFQSATTATAITATRAPEKRTLVQRHPSLKCMSQTQPPLTWRGRQGHSGSCVDVTDLLNHATHTVTAHYGNPHCTSTAPIKLRGCRGRPATSHNPLATARLARNDMLTSRVTPSPRHRLACPVTLHPAWPTAHCRSATAGYDHVKSRSPCLHMWTWQLHSPETKHFPLPSPAHCRPKALQQHPLLHAVTDASERTHGTSYSGAAPVTNIQPRTPTRPKSSPL